MVLEEHLYLPSHLRGQGRVVLQKSLSFGCSKEGVDQVAGLRQRAAVGTVFVCCSKPFIAAWHRQRGTICELLSEQLGEHRSCLPLRLG